MLKSPVLVVNAIRVDGSIVACARIARFLRVKLGCEVLDSAQVALRHRRYPTVVMINSPWGFCDEAHRARVRELLWAAKRVIWVQNDYNSGIGPRSFKSMGAWLDGEGNAGVQVKDGVRRLELLTTIPEYVERGYVTARIPLAPRSAYVNWNALHYQPLKLSGHQYRKEGELFYFGAFRHDRAARFAKYLDPRYYPVLISTAVGRSVERFRALLGPRVRIETREQNLIYRLSTEWATVYLEDERANELYCSPAGRFYEALSAGCCQFIDADAVSNLERTGFKVNPAWVVREAGELKAKLHLAPAFAAEQRKAWATSAIRRQLTRQLAKVL